MDLAKLLDVLTSLPVSHAILPRAVCFATSRPANHAICSFIDLSGYASGPIRKCLFIDYIIIIFIDRWNSSVTHDIAKIDNYSVYRRLGNNKEYLYKNIRVGVRIIFS